MGGSLRRSLTGRNSSLTRILQKLESDPNLAETRV
jgi:hypothetical protein